MDHYKPKARSTALKQASEEGCSHFKIEQNAKFAKGVDAVREVSPKLAEKILKPIYRTAKFGIGSNLISLYTE